MVGERVDERHVGDDPGEQLGGLVGDHAHEQAAGAAALRDDAALRRIAFGDQMAGGGEEVGERVGLAVRACPPRTSASPCRSRRAHGRSRRRSRDRRARSGWSRSAPRSHSHRSRSRRAAAAPNRRALTSRRIRSDTGTVSPSGGGREHEPRDIARRVEARRDDLPLDQRPLARRAVVVVNLFRPRHRRIGEADARTVELVDRLEVERVSLLVEGDVVARAGRSGPRRSGAGGCLRARAARASPTSTTASIR